MNNQTCANSPWCEEDRCCCEGWEQHEKEVETKDTKIEELEGKIEELETENEKVKSDYDGFRSDIQGHFDQLEEVLKDIIRTLNIYK